MDAPQITQLPDNWGHKIRWRREVTIKKRVRVWKIDCKERHHRVFCVFFIHCYLETFQHLGHIASRVFGCVPEGCVFILFYSQCFILLNTLILILWYMNLMNNGQMDRGNKNPTQNLPWWLRKTTKKPNQVGWYRELNPGPPECESRALPRNHLALLFWILSLLFRRKTRLLNGHQSVCVNFFCSLANNF